MAAFPLALVMGFLAGFLGAIPPGPLGVTCLRKSLQGERRDAYRVAFGGASVDTFICALIGLGLGWILEKVVTNPWVKGTLAVFLVGYGAKLLFVDARRDAERIEPVRSRLDFIPPPSSGPPREGRLRLPVLTGLLQGAANPALFVNWTLFISFLVGHRLVRALGGRRRRLRPRRGSRRLLVVRRPHRVRGPLAESRGSMGLALDARGGRPARRLRPLFHVAHLQRGMRRP